MNTLEQQKAQIEKLEADLKAAIELNEQAQTQVTALTTERDSSRADLTKATADLAAAQATIGERDKTIEASAQEITTLKSEATSVEKKAAQLLASQGHAPLDITPATDGAAAAGAKSLLEKFNSLTGAAKSDFWKKHKAQLLREQFKQG